jgi:hypothetical protein
MLAIAIIIIGTMGVPKKLVNLFMLNRSDSITPGFSFCANCNAAIRQIAPPPTDTIHKFIAAKMAQ